MGFVYRDRLARASLCCLAPRAAPWPRPSRMPLRRRSGSCQAPSPRSCCQPFRRSTLARSWLALASACLRGVAVVNSRWALTIVIAAKRCQPACRLGSDSSVGTGSADPTQRGELAAAARGLGRLHALLREFEPWGVLRTMALLSGGWSALLRGRRRPAGLQAEILMTRPQYERGVDRQGAARGSSDAVICRARGAASARSTSRS